FTVIPPVAHDQIAQLPGEVRLRAGFTKQRRGMSVQPLPESRLGSARVGFGQKWMSRRGNVDALQVAEILHRVVEPGVARTLVFITQSDEPRRLHVAVANQVAGHAN